MTNGQGVYYWWAILIVFGVVLAVAVVLTFALFAWLRRQSVR